MFVYSVLTQVSWEDSTVWPDFSFEATSLVSALLRWRLLVELFLSAGVAAEVLSFDVVVAVAAVALVAVAAFVASTVADDF